MNEKRPQLPIESVDESHAKEVERKRNIDEECLTKKGVKRTKRATKESGSTVVKSDPAPIHRRRRRLIEEEVEEEDEIVAYGSSSSAAAGGRAPSASHAPVPDEVELAIPSPLDMRCVKETAERVGCKVCLQLPAPPKEVCKSWMRFLPLVRWDSWDVDVGESNQNDRGAVGDGDDLGNLALPLLTQDDWDKIDAVDGQEKDYGDARSVVVEEPDHVSRTDDDEVKSKSVLEEPDYVSRTDDNESSVVDFESDIESISTAGQVPMESEVDNLEPPVDSFESSSDPAEAMERARLNADMALACLEETTIILECSMQAWARAEGVIEDVNERLEMKIKRLRDEARERQASYERSQRYAWEQRSKWKVGREGRSDE
ncbi:hypothetical protein B0O80DRAFT_9486 [Mortierella sp. GBAus27b]|nr:hypothetical protein B0O80DRAFT_9486 [Mortierella sp. GBAus27b]